MKYIFFILWVSWWASGCSAIRQKASAPLQTGIYQIKQNKFSPKETVYVATQNDSIKIYPVVICDHQYQADTVLAKTYVFDTQRESFQLPQSFTQISTDVDLLTIAFKYRPSTSRFPNQFNTNLNGAFYLGKRVDRYVISYTRNPLNQFEKNTRRYAYGFGLFAGAGSTTMNPSVTRGRLAEEYDGVVFTKGIAGIIGLGGITFGLALGIDHLLDANHRLWIYQGKPWLGITIGLNIN